ncbi:hypothetical protein ES705_12235 [subsurface metagenome]
MVARKDIMLDSDAEKEKVYEQVDALFLQGKAIKVKEHKSGFPAITIDAEDIHILTDILSLEQWWHQKRLRKDETKS